MTRITNFNRMYTAVENLLSMAAAIPVAGIPIAACKFTLGAVQMITALALGIITLPFRFCSDDAAAFNDHCWTHFVHGLGNMAASIAEAIPFLGLGILFIRLDGEDGLGITNPEFQEKYIPYSDVIQENLNVKGTLYRNHLPNHADLYFNTKEPTCLSPTQFRQVTGFNAIITPLA